MGYKIQALSSFERAFSKLDEELRKRITKKIEHLADYPKTIGAPMRNLPSDLKGLHKVRVGGWRIFFWVDHPKHEITLYDIDRRDKAYKHLR